MKALERLLRAATSLARSLRGSAPFRRGSVTVWEATGEPGQYRISEIRDSRADRLALRDIVEELSSFPEWTTAEALLTALVDERKIEPPGIVRPGVAGAYLEPLILSYFDRLSDVRWQPQAASATVRGLLHHLQEETTPVRRLLVLGGFSAARTFRIDSEIRFRPISEADILSITRDRSHGGPSVAFPLRTDWWVCELVKQNSRGSADGWNALGPVGESVTYALRFLKGDELPIWHAVTEGVGAYGSMGRGFGEPPMHFQWIGKYHLSASDIRRLKTLWRKLQPVFTADHHYLDLALRRLEWGASRRAAEDKIVDYVVGLEALLTTDDEPRTDLAFRFQTHGPMVLASDLAGRTEHRGRLRELYRTRRAIVHGSTPKGERLAENIEYGGEALRGVVRWFLENHGDDPDNKNGVRHLDELLLT